MLRRSGGLKLICLQIHYFAPPPRGGFALSEMEWMNPTKMHGDTLIVYKINMINTRGKWSY